MPEGLYLGFDFGYKRIGVAVGHALTGRASPLERINAQSGVPDWRVFEKLLKTWNPQGCVVGLPTCIDGTEQYTTIAAREFANQIHERFKLPVFLTDERLTTKEARAHLFSQGGYRKVKKTDVDSIAACLIIEQWMSDENSI